MSRNSSIAQPPLGLRSCIRPFFFFRPTPTLRSNTERRAILFTDSRRNRRADLCDEGTHSCIRMLVGADTRHTCRVSAASAPLAVRRPGGSGGLFDPESLHQRLQGRTFHPETRRRAPLPPQHPVALFQGT